ncbi:hypothetical protein Q3G72_002544 [Acer saccharum]|nr:hypothetical protein Q3G72_002544 [Acer saccharum]
MLQDCFDPIIERVSKTDIIPSIVYGQVVVSAGIFRIFGEEVAKLPLVATSKDSQGQGYFQSLFSCIDKLLGFLHVKNLVLPSASEAESIWTNKFGFDKMTEEEGTSMLQKKVPKYRFVGKSAEGCEVWGRICANFKIGEAGKVVLTIENPTSKKKELFYHLKTKPNSSACQTLSC